MKLKDQVCSLELAKKLKELGVKQESLFYWATDGNRNWLDIKINGLFYDFNFQVADDDFYKRNEFYQYSAFTVAELGEMLPKGHWTNGAVCKGCCDRNLNYFCEYEIDFENPEAKKELIYANTEANARAKMLIYLLENKLWK